MGRRQLLLASRSGLECLEGCVHTEDVPNLKGGAVVHHKVATDNYVYVVWRCWRKHPFQFPRAQLDLFVQARGQSSIHH